MQNIITFYLQNLFYCVELLFIKNINIQEKCIKLNNNK